MSQEFIITEWEQGTIDDRGNNESSSTRVRMPAYIAVNSRSDLTTTFIATATDTNGTPLKINIMMYDSDYDVVYDNGWNDSGEILTYNKNISYIRLILRYSNSDNIVPSDVASCTVIYDNGLNWLIQNNELTNSEFIDMPATPFVDDSPLSMWRINPNINNGMPYVPLMIDLQSIPMYIQPSRPLIHAYSSRETDFNGNGYAIIEPISCTVRQEEQGLYEAEFEAYCDKWDKFTYLRKQAQVKLPIRYHGELKQQIFRIRQTARRMDSEGNYRVQATAQHKFYDLQRYMIEDCRPSEKSGSEALTWLMTNGWYGGVPSVPEFTYASDVSEVRTAYYQNCSVVAALLGVDQAFVNRWGGRLYRDNNYFSINQEMEGCRKSGIIQYSYNMTEIEFEEDDSQLITILKAEDNFGNTYTITNPNVPTEDIPHHIYGCVRFSYEAENVALFHADAQAYFDEYKQSRVSITVRFANLADIEKYKQFLELDSFEVGDKITIYHKELDIYYSNLEVISKTFDVVSQKTMELQIGSFKDAVTRRAFMADTVSNGGTVQDKQYIALDEQLDEVAFFSIVQRPISTIDGKLLVTKNGKYIQYK